MHVEKEVTGAITGEKVGKAGVYVYEGPVRLWHWVSALCIVVLAVTGYLIASPLPTMGSGEASEHFLMGYIRFVHFATAYIFAIGSVARIYWAIVGNHHAQQIFTLNLTDSGWWRGMWKQIRWYLLLEPQAPKFIGHNPFEQLVAFFAFTLTSLMMIATGFALYSEGAQKGSWADALFGWVIPLLGQSQDVHTWHHLGMWVIIWYVLVHLYTVIREEILSRQTFVSTMINGYRLYKD